MDEILSATLVTTGLVPSPVAFGVPRRPDSPDREQLEDAGVVAGRCLQDSVTFSRTPCTFLWRYLWLIRGSRRDCHGDVMMTPCRESVHI